MVNKPMKSYSLLTLLLLCAIAALCASHYWMSRELARARAEVDSIRRNYGYIRVDNGTKVYVSSIAQHKGSSHDSLRIVVPPGERYFLHLSETSALPGQGPPTCKPRTTVALNGWKDGADEILSYSIGWPPDSEIPKLRVNTPTEDFYTYVPDDWPRGVPLSIKSQVAADPQAEFDHDEPIVLMFANAPSIDRGVMLWLEPESRYKARLAAQKQTDEH